MDAYRLCLTLLTCVLLAQTAHAQSFMECANIEADSDRLDCYDAAAAAMRKSLEKPQVGPASNVRSSAMRR